MLRTQRTSLRQALLHLHPNAAPNARTCSWLSPDPEILLKYNSGALLRVDHMGSIHYWIVAPVESGFMVTEEVLPGVFRSSVTVDTTFGDALKDWSCDCDAFRDQGHRRSEHGCLHCRVVFAAVAHIGLIEEGGDEA